MNLHLIKTYVTFIESDSMQKAAEKLKLTQAAVSQQLKAIEEDLGQELFVFQGKKKIPSLQGMAVYEALRAELRKLEGTWDRLRTAHLPVSQLSITIAGRKEMLENIVDKIHFLGCVNFESAPSKVAYERLLDREVDVALITFRPKHARIVQKKVFSIGSRWFTPSKIPLKDLQSEKIYQFPIVTFSKDLPHLTQWCETYGLNAKELKIKAIIDNWHMVKCLCVKHEAISIVPDNIDVYSEFDAHPISHQVIKPVDFYYAFHEDTRPLLNRGEFAFNS